MIFPRGYLLFWLWRGSFPGCISSYNVYVRTDDVHTLVHNVSDFFHTLIPEHHYASDGPCQHFTLTNIRFSPISYSFRPCCAIVYLQTNPGECLCLQDNFKTLIYIFS